MKFFTILLEVTGLGIVGNASRAAILGMAALAPLKDLVAPVLGISRPGGLS
jgi:hypothetical protein